MGRGQGQWRCRECGEGRAEQGGGMGRISEEGRKREVREERGWGKRKGMEGRRKETR